MVPLTGQNSFPSGHTMSGFALYTIVALLWNQKSWGGLIAVSFAVLTGISRIYLVHHFLEDVVSGAIVGVLIALIIYYFQMKRLNSSDKIFA